MPPMHPIDPIPRIIPVVVLVAPDVLLLDLAAILEPLRLANDWARARGANAADRFSVQCVGPKLLAQSSCALSLANIAALPATLPDGAWLILPGSAPGATGYDGALALQCASWLRDVGGQAAMRITVCSGALLGARVGWLDSHQCTTHHDLIERLRAMAPGAHVAQDRIFVVDRTLATSAGITAGLDLMLHLIGGVLGTACELALARDMVVYLRRAGGDPQLSAFLARRNHLHPAVHRVQDAVTADLGGNWTLASMARIAHVTPRHLARLFSQHAECSPAEYIERLRVARARELLLDRKLSVEHAAAQAGFSGAQQLRRAWKTIYGGSPKAARS